MSTTVQRRMAEQLYQSGHALFEQGRYTEALKELHLAADAFRTLDSRGHPFSHPLSNGISGLANSLVLLGSCCLHLGDYKTALSYFETTFINAKFERRKPFRRFTQQLAKDMIYCYDKMVDDVNHKELENRMKRDDEIDVSFRFPHSLPTDLIPFARLYELSPTRYSRYENFYKRCKQKDAELRKQSKTADSSTMKRMSFYVWSILFLIWAIYGIIVVETLVRNKK